MFASISFLAAASIAQIGTATVTEVHLTKSFAGKLGYRVTERLGVEMKGKAYEVIIEGAYHTLFSKPSLSYKAGDELLISGSVSGNKIRAFRWNLRKTH